MASTNEQEADPAAERGPVWFRFVVLGALLLTLWLFGPRVWRIVEARWMAPTDGGPPVAIDRLGIRQHPEWLRDRTLHALLQELAPRLRRPVGMMDREALSALRGKLLASGWFHELTLERAYPDRLRVRTRVRRPVVEVRYAGVVLGLADAEGIALPAAGIASGLPFVEVGPRGGEPHDGAPPRAGEQFRFGEPFPDGRVLVAAAVAEEWREGIGTVLDQAPSLRVIDADNLGWDYVQDPRYSQVLVGLESTTGRIVWFHHGLAERDGGPVPVEIRASILRDVVRSHPGLVGLAGGDLRLKNLWRDALRFVAAEAPR